MKNNKISNSQQRLAELMKSLHLKQADICKRTGIDKSTLSLYLNGKRDPRQDKISLICEAYGINPAWLIGYDVPMFLSEVEDSPARKYYDDDQELISLYKNATPAAKEAVLTLLRASQM